MLYCPMVEMEHDERFCRNADSCSDPRCIFHPFFDGTESREQPLSPVEKRRNLKRDEAAKIRQLAMEIANDRIKYDGFSDETRQALVDAMLASADKIDPDTP